MFEFLKIEPDSYLKTSCEIFFLLHFLFFFSMKQNFSFAFQRGFFLRNQILRVILIRIAHLDFTILVGFPKNDLDFSLSSYMEYGYGWHSDI